MGGAGRPQASTLDPSQVVGGGMTQQYLVGELSVLLGLLQAAAADPASVRAVASLRHEAETRPPDGLGPVVRQVLALTDLLCWRSLSQSDPVAFAHQAKIAAEIHDFGICAGLLEED